MPQNKNTSTDLQDSERDKQYLKQEQTTIDIPDVKDIPGQEHVHVPKMKEMIDTTISSDDEEGEGLFDDETDEDEIEVDEIDEIDEDEIELDENDEEAGDDETDEYEEEDETDEDADVTAEEKELLQSSSESMGTEDDKALKRSLPDNTDDDGELLNEQNDESGDDLDIPGAELDDEDEATGNEDEENNAYSLGQ